MTVISKNFVEEALRVVREARKATSSFYSENMFDLGEKFVQAIK